MCNVYSIQYWAIFKCITMGDRWVLKGGWAEACIQCRSLELCPSNHHYPHSLSSGLFRNWHCTHCHIIIRIFFKTIVRIIPKHSSLSSTLLAKIIIRIIFELLLELCPSNHHYPHSLSSGLFWNWHCTQVIIIFAALSSRWFWNYC